MKIRLQQNNPTRVIKNLDDLRDLVGDEPELGTGADDSAGLATARAPPEARDAAPARDADGFQPVGGRGGAGKSRSSSRRDKAEGRS